LSKYPTHQIQFQEPFYLDLVLRNPLQTGIKVTHIDIQVANSDPTDQADDLSSSLEIAPVDDLELLPLEKREASYSSQIQIGGSQFRRDTSLTN
jgi:hypothetical protein